MTRMVTVHAGPLWEVQLLRGKLEAEGIPCFLPDETTKRVDPFITGANALNVQLQVRDEDVERARSFVEEYVALTRRQATDAAPAAGEDAELPESVKDYLRDQTRLGRRIRWASLLVVTAPIALVLGLRYIDRNRHDAPHPNGHGLNLAAIVLAGGFTFVGVALLVRLLLDAL